MLEKSDRMRVLSKLDEMVRYVEELKGMFPGKDEYLNDLIKRRACEKTVEVAIESLIDVSGMIVSGERFGLPTSEESIFDMLVERGILRIDLGEKLKDMKGFRNILIHRYAHVNDGIVYRDLSSYLNDFYDFKGAVESYLKK